DRRADSPELPLCRFSSRAQRHARVAAHRAGSGSQYAPGESSAGGRVDRSRGGDLPSRLRHDVRPPSREHSLVAFAARRLDDCRGVRQGALTAGSGSRTSRALHHRRVRCVASGSAVALAPAWRAECSCRTGSDHRRHRCARCGDRQRGGERRTAVVGTRERQVERLAMTTGMFIDRVVVRGKAGDGGSGIISFRREQFVPMGGPDGGDGGRGGDVIVNADSNLSTLLDYTYRDRWEAESGAHGSGANKTGRSGVNAVLPVPPGTVVRDLSRGEVLGEVLEDGDELPVARGGRGGKGNAWFATATHQAPREYQPGEDGDQRTLELELKLIADVGLVGQPNAGKSTLLSVISAARPKIADYPFTTLSPNLGVVQLSDARTFVVADIPGIIE